MPQLYDAWLNRRVEWLMRRAAPLSHTAALVVSALVYVCIGLVVPWACHVGTATFVVWNLGGVVAGFVVLMAWIAVRAQEKTRHRLLDWSSDLRHLNATEFEWLTGELLRREGWTVLETGRPDQPDGNVDLRATRADETLLVQCKQWSARSIGVDEVRKMGGTLLREGLDGRSGAVVTTSDFTTSARAEALQLGMTLIDGGELVRRVDRARGTEPCPSCETPMVLDQSVRGWWLRCTRYAEGCVGKRDLGAHLGRAAGLLYEAM